MRSIAFAITTFSLLFGVLGCGGGDVEKKEYTGQPVTGTLKVSGKPMAGVTVMFVPADGASGDQTTASGVTNEAGEFTISMPGGKEGVPVGNYRVLFTKVVKKDGTPLAPDEMAADAGAENILPLVYSDPTETPVGAEVPDGGKKFDFEIKGR